MKITAAVGERNGDFNIVVVDATGSHAGTTAEKGVDSYSTLPVDAE